MTTETSFEGHVKSFPDDPLSGAFACMQGRRLGHGGSREQPFPPTRFTFYAGTLLSLPTGTWGKRSKLPKVNICLVVGIINETLIEIIS